MAKTILITGSSTGIGKSTAILFATKGWNVIATMRSPEKESELKKFENVLLTRLDVHDPKSIDEAINLGILKFKKIDVVVNNAGYGLVGAFEGMTIDQVRRQFETNVFGLMEVTHRILPHMRTNRSGIIINISSIAGRVAFPLYSIYHSTKWAVEGFSESLQYELNQFNIRVKIVEPGAIKTDFYHRSADRSIDKVPDEYKSFVNHTMKKTDEAGELGSPPLVVAKAIYLAATDHSKKLRYTAGFGASSLLFIRRFLPDRIFSKIVRMTIGI